MTVSNSGLGIFFRKAAILPIKQGQFPLNIGHLKPYCPEETIKTDAMTTENAVCRQLCPAGGTCHPRSRNRMALYCCERLVGRPQRRAPNKPFGIHRFQFFPYSPDIAFGNRYALIKSMKSLTTFGWASFRLTKYTLWKSTGRSLMRKHTTS